MNDLVNFTLRHYPQPKPINQFFSHQGLPLLPASIRMTVLRIELREIAKFAISVVQGKALQADAQF
jgi:hypothetical protein